MPDETNSSPKEALSQCVRKNVEEIKQTFMHEMDEKFTQLIDNLTNDLHWTSGLQQNEIVNLFVNGKSHKKTVGPAQAKSRSATLPDKEFTERNSLLTDLFAVKHIKTIYNVFIVFLFILFLNTIVHDLVADGRINIGLQPIFIGFGNVQYALLTWALLQTITLCGYFGFKFWAVLRRRISAEYTRIWDYTWLIAFVCFQLSLACLPVKALLHYDLALASSMALLMEACRFTMKTHAFVRSNVPRVIRPKAKTDKNASPELLHSQLPSFSKFLYFLFAPTLVYRDNYPRTKYIRWNFVAVNLIEVIGCIFYIGYLVDRFATPVVRKFGDEQKMEASSLVLIVFGTMLPAQLIFLCGFYCLLHAWMNCFAEILRFGDRMFYMDWWNASSFDMYYRTWNVVVHDWLYTYIYKDVYENISRQNKTISALVVFTVSAVIHELIIAFTFRFFYPVMFVFFEGFGLFYMYVTRGVPSTIGNMILWFSLAVGNGLMFALYTIEYFARLNCTQTDNSIMNYLKPVSWTCHGIVNNPNWQITMPWSD